MSTGGWIFSILASLIFLALIVVLIVWLLSTVTGGATTSRSGSGGSPQEILDRRLASGELTVEQYRQLRDTLAHNTPAERSTPSGGPGPQTPPRAAGAASG